VRKPRERPLIDKLFSLGPNDNDGKPFDYPIMIPDPGLPSYSKSLLFGLDFDFMIFECLVLACMDRCNYLPNGI
jgi:hypothetical protein